MRRLFMLILSGSICLSMPVTANWCTGHWLGLQWFEMSLSERVNGAVDALTKRQSLLQSAVNRIDNEADTSHRQLAERLQSEQQQLYSDTEKLCRLKQEAHFPVDYNGADLLDEQQLLSQLRLNLELYLAHESVEKVLGERIDQQRVLSQAITTKLNELSLLSEQMEVAQESQASVFTANRFVQTTCVAVETSDALLERVPEDSLENFISLVLQKEQQAVSPTAIRNLLADCTGLIKPVPVESRGWFSQLSKDQ